MIGWPATTSFDWLRSSSSLKGHLTLVDGIVAVEHPMKFGLASAVHLAQLPVRSKLVEPTLLSHLEPHVEQLQGVILCQAARHPFSERPSAPIGNMQDGQLVGVVVIPVHVANPLERDAAYSDHRVQRALRATLAGLNNLRLALVDRNLVNSRENLKAAVVQSLYFELHPVVGTDDAVYEIRVAVLTQSEDQDLWSVLPLRTVIPVRQVEVLAKFALNGRPVLDYALWLRPLQDLADEAGSSGNSAEFAA
ncbi:hypothetical protein [Conexibacter woesei]|uniref:hypothetical protein n=1 Tax=Conexibacter woesei TaxID=191495 RepID=UPI0011D248C4|nr:hypothetical protein [Conexibacter woesei]